MDLTKLPVINAITKRMYWLNQRQKVLAENIANANTPGYKARDLEKLNFKNELRQTTKMKMSATSGSHIAAKTYSNVIGFKARDEKDAYEMSPDGNTVTLEQQMLKVAESKMDYELMTNLYRKHMGMIKTALGRGK